MSACARRASQSALSMLCERHLVSDKPDASGAAQLSNLRNRCRYPKIVSPSISTRSEVRQHSSTRTFGCHESQRRMLQCRRASCYATPTWVGIAAVNYDRSASGIETAREDRNERNTQPPDRPGNNETGSPSQHTALDSVSRHAFTFVSLWSFLIRSSISGLVRRLGRASAANLHGIEGVE